MKTYLRMFVRIGRIFGSKLHIFYRKIHANVGWLVCCWAAKKRCCLCMPIFIPIGLVPERLGAILQ